MIGQKVRPKEYVEKLMFKHESYEEDAIVGPLWKVVGGKTVNYEDSDMKRHDGTFFPKWFTLRAAKDIASRMNIELQEV
jgi:hypothetical protein